MSIRNVVLFGASLISCLVLFCANKLSNDYKSLVNQKKSENDIKGVEQPVSIEMYDILEKYSDEYDIPKYIVYNIAYLETTYQGPFDWDYKHNRTSSAGAVGPMQIMPSTANYINDKIIPTSELKNDIELNVVTSMKLLSRLYDKYENWEIVCGCYNTGKPIINQYAQFCVSNTDYYKNWVSY
jgi:soluble lytic murein transglycosylase-like protein